MRPSSARRHLITRPAALIAAGVVLGALSAPAVPAADTYSFDLSHSNVGFSIRHFFSKVPGTFTKYEGAIVYDSQDLSKSSVNITIDAASIDTRHTDREASAERRLLRG